MADEVAVSFGVMAAVAKTTVLEAFRTSGLHGEIEPDKTYCFVKVTSADDQSVHKVSYDLLWRTNDDEKHAEEKCIEDISQVLKERNTDVTLEIYISNAPCEVCCSKLKDFITESKQICQVHVYMASLQGLPRRSCITGNCFKVHKLPCGESVEGGNKGLELYRLTRVGKLELQVFQCQEDWMELVKLINFADKLTGDDVVYSSYCNHNMYGLGRGRKRTMEQEDKIMTKDLIYLLSIWEIIHQFDSPDDSQTGVLFAAIDEVLENLFRSFTLYK